eukprot:scaffold708_cov86-Isochrysis_galbana.AAC.5
MSELIIIRILSEFVHANAKFNLVQRLFPQAPSRPPRFRPEPRLGPLRTRGPPGLMCWFALSDCHGDTHPSGHFHFHVFTRCDTFAFVSAPAACYLSRSPPVRLASCPTLACSSSVLSTLFRTLTLVPRLRRRRLLAGTHLRPAIVASLCTGYLWSCTFRLTLCSLSS